MKLNKNKILIALSLIGTINIAQAQWAVNNINDVLYFGPTGIFTQAVGKMNMAINSSIQSQQATQKVAIAQQDTNMAVQDSRMRRTLGLSEIAKLDNATRPNIDDCVEASRSQYQFSAGISSALPGGRRPGSTAPKNNPKPTLTTPDETAKKIKSIATNQAVLLNAMKDAGTCSDEYGGIGECSANGPYPKADIIPTGIKGNMKGAESNRDISNYSLDEQGYSAGVEYIKNATMYDTPKLPDPKQLKTNPSYLPMYKSIMSKLNAAQEALFNILNLRAGSHLSTLGQSLWNKDSTAYKEIFPGLTAPTNPSMFDLINLTVYKNLLKQETLTDAEVAREQLKRTALSNYISWKQLQSQEDTNILLSHILTQSVTPVHKNQVDSEYSKFTSTTTTK